MKLRVVGERYKGAIVVNQRFVGSYKLSGIRHRTDIALSVGITEAFCCNIRSNSIGIVGRDVGKRRVTSSSAGSVSWCTYCVM